MAMVAAKGSVSGFPTNLAGRTGTRSNIRGEI
jgi:hypothetical protein